MWFNKAGILENLGRYEEAIAAYDKALTTGTADTPVGPGSTLVAKGRTLEKLGRNDEALTLYGRVPANDRYYGEALKGKAALQERKGDREAALVSYRAAASVYKKQKEYKSAVECFDRILALDPSDNEALYLKGAALVNQHSDTSPAGLLDQALACLDSALAKEPQHAGILTAKGRCTLEKNNIEESLRFFDQALAIHPADYEALMHKGLALMRLMRYDEALAVFDRTCSQHPDNAVPWSLKAAIRVNQGNYAQGLSDIDQAIRCSEQDYTCWETRAKILRKLGRTAAAEESEAAAKRYSWFLNQ
jgi:tetratricopeptide (TPR) repeat protein